MARDCYETTIALPDAAAAYVMKPLSAVKVSVVPRGATDIPNSLIDIFPADTGLTKGPDPKTGATGTNPFTTGVSGAVRFWAEGPAELDLVFEDTQTPARITDRVGWNAIPAKAGSIATSVLAQDGGIRNAHLHAEVVAQEVPIGGCIDWFRPNGSTANPPVGFEVADGHSVTQHDFPTVAGAVGLPNLQNVFILGATSGKADANGAGADDLPGSGPGIRGSGGSNAPKNLAHGHTSPTADHYHNTTTADHTHNGNAISTGNHSHAVGTSATGYYVAHYVAAGGATQIANRDHTHSGWTDVAGNLGGGAAQVAYMNATHGGAMGAASSQIAAWVGGAGNGWVATGSTTWTADPGTDFRPRFYGLLRLIKVRRAIT
jgi:hypothetical protein